MQVMAEHYHHTYVHQLHLPLAVKASPLWLTVETTNRITKYAAIARLCSHIRGGKVQL